MTNKEGIVTIVLADDHSIIREGIKGLLELDPAFSVIGEAKDGTECINVVKELEPDVLLLDINMPGANGLDVINTLRTRYSLNTRILVLTIHDEAQYLRRAMSYGANGYVLKDSNFNTLQEGIRAVMRGEDFIDKKLINIFNEKAFTKDSFLGNENDMTRREREILILISKGFINKEIANYLSISEKTVKNHISNLFKKINVSDRTQAAVFAIKNKYVEI